jgi:acetolactate synthase-1/2/3 large subunit
LRPSTSNHSKKADVIREEAARRGGVDRRAFLKSASAGAAALVAAPLASQAESAAQATAPGKRNATAPIARVAKDIGEPQGAAEALTVERPGSDFMVDVIKSLGFEYVCSNPGNTFRGLHESLINYGGNQKPEFITCLHEESSVGMAHGYAKIEGKPLLVLAHATVGAQHAAMAVYDAFCDRVPVYMILGNISDATRRTNFVDWVHTAQEPAALLRDFVKWDDQPVSLPHFAESAVRAYKVAMTPPTMPVVLVADVWLQQDQVPANADLRVPKLGNIAPPQGDSGAVAETARLLVAAENPVILADRAARTPAGLASLVELAELLQSAVIDKNGRMNFPTRHPLNQTERAHAAVAAADVILGLELTDFFGSVNSYQGQLQPVAQRFAKPGAKLISITANDLYVRSNYQDMQRYTEVDLAIAADAEATLPALIEAVKRLITDDRRAFYRDRGAKLAAAHQKTLEQTRELAAYGWDASPISTARLSAELWNQIKGEDWSFVSDGFFVSRWPLRLWSFDKHYQFIGGAGAYGVGYGAPAAVGAALANRKYGRLSVNIQNDGDLMFAPGVLWTAAHHRIPILNIMHNNRAYHQEVMEVQKMANQRNRGITRANIGTTLVDPPIDYAKFAQSMGMYAEGPISDPKELAPALRRAIDVVKRGEPALLDVLTQPR